MIAPIVPPTLSAFLETAYLPSRFRLSSQYVESLRRIVRQFSAYLGQPALLCDLTDQTVTGWLAEESRSIGPVTINDKRRMLLTLWRAAWQQRLLSELPRDVPRAQELKRLPRAWEIAQVRELVAYLKRIPGSVDGLSAASWWTSLVVCVYWTGTRIGAALQVRCEDLDLASGCILIRAETQKHRADQLFSLPPDVLRLLQSIWSAEREFLWPWPYHRRTLFGRFRRYVEAAGLPAPRTGRQLFQRLRRTSVSYAARESLELARRLAGHSSIELTRKHYIDERIATVPSAADVLPPLDV